MKGHIRQRGKRSWAIVLDLDRDTGTGRRRQKWHAVHGTKRDAERELARLLTEMNSGAYLEPSKLTVREYLEKWLEDYARHNVSGKTFERYSGIVRDHLAAALGAIPLTKLQPLHIQAHYSQALQDGRKDGRPGGLSAQSVLHHHRVLHKALDQAVRWQILIRNPANAVEPPRPEPKEIEPLDETRSAWLLEAAEGTRLYVPVLLAITTGMRRGEILAMRWSDADLQSGFFYVQRSLEETRAGGVRFKETKSRRGRRSISLPALTIEALRLHRTEQEHRKALLDAAYENNDLICCLEDGTVWKPSAFTSAYRNLLRRRGLPRTTFHNLRHSHASQLLRSGISPKVISERLGHSKVGFTLEVYSHLLPGMQEEAARRTDANLGAAIEKRQRKIA